MKRSEFIQKWASHGDSYVESLAAAERLADLVAEKYSFDPEDPTQTDPASQLLHDAIGLLQLRVHGWVRNEGSWNSKAAETVAAYHKLFHP